MKKASDILSHLVTLPQFKYLKQQYCYKKYIKLLTPKYQKAIAFVYIKEHTLFIALTHPGFKMELNYNKDLLKSLLTHLSTHDKQCSMMKATGVVVFHSKYHPVEERQEPFDSIPYYKEQASSNFEIHSQDKRLIRYFERIKEEIRCNK